MATAVTSLNTTTPTTTTSTTSAGGTSLTSSDFLNLMIQQLAQQDPLNPTDSNQLLTQMSQISQLQSNTDMQTSLSSLTLQQSIGAGGNLIGKSVTGLDASGNKLTGTVTSVQVTDQQVYLGLDSGSVLPMSNVTQISPAATTPTSADSALVNELAQLLAGAGTTTTAATPTAASDSTTNATAAGATSTPAAIPSAVASATTAAAGTARAKVASLIAALAGVAQ